jgi:hypothetical protein
MDETTTAQEVTTIETQAPQQVVRKTTTQSSPQAKGEAPQKVYEQKKTILRSNQIIWYILGLLEVLLAFRFALKTLGANPYVGFTSFIYALTNPLTAPFNGILGSSTFGSAIIEASTIIAGIVYLCLAWGLVYLLDLIYPISPKDVEAE